MKTINNINTIETTNFNINTPADYIQPDYNYENAFKQEQKTLK